MATVRNDFDLDGTFTVSVEVLRFRGEDYARGRPFDWRGLGLDPRELWQLWIALKVDCSPTARPALPSSPVELPTVNESPTCTPVEYDRTCTVGLASVASEQAAEKLSRAERRARARASR